MFPPHDANPSTRNDDPGNTARPGAGNPYPKREEETENAGFPGQSGRQETNDIQFDEYELARSKLVALIERIRWIAIGTLVLLVGLATLAALHTLISRHQDMGTRNAQLDSGSPADGTLEQARQSETIQLSQDVRARLFAPPEEDQNEDAAKAGLDILWRDADSRETERATALFEAYMDAGGNWRKITRLIRAPDATIPKMEGFYRGNDKRLPRLAKAEPVSILHVEWSGTNILRCQMQMVDEATRIAFLVQEEQEGDFLLDWESFEYYLPVPWHILLNDRPHGESSIRVIVKPSNDYVKPFADPRRFDAFHLSRISEDRILFGYVERGSDAHRQLVGIFAGNSPGTINTMVLKIRYPENATSTRQVLITGVASPFWLVP